MVGLGGFTIVNNVNGTSDIPVLTEEFVPVTEDIVENTTSIRYVNHGTMRASWYGPRFHGKTTANGEIYDQSALTAAHKSLRFGTIL